MLPADGQHAVQASLPTADGQLAVRVSLLAADSQSAGQVTLSTDGLPCGTPRLTLEVNLLCMSP